ncbi:MAG: hypothetical protein ACJART_001498 [Maribacter sp.]|jgi:hypothetical protein
MKRIVLIIKKIGVVLGLLSVPNACETNTDSSDKLFDIDFELFEKVSPKISGVQFVNELKEEFHNGINRFEYDYFYNGAGVGVADLNNDGLQDLLLVGNQVESKLYLNQGEFAFDDITKSSNINQNKGWSTGVTFADINNDGWIDIYISQGGPLGYDRSNRLYINQGNLTFKEESQKYGLDYKGISTQSVFFDYDLDGDLDCLIINEHPLYGYSAREFQYYLKKEPNLLHASSCHLFENINGKYTEVTEKAGLLKPAFGLGMVVTDINDDGFQDFYLSNDYYIPDALYINKGDGTFKDEVKERTNQVAYAGMGVDIADLNNDGSYDIFSLDMASADHIRSKTLMQPMDVKYFNYLVDDLDYQNAYMFNTLQLGIGNGTFQNVPHIAGVTKTDWSWAGLIADLDNDADKDIFVTNGTEFTLDNDFHTKIQEVYARYPAPQPIPVFELEQLHKQIPHQKLPNVVFENQGDLKFKDRAQNWGLQDSTSSNGAVYADLDLDGDLDLVVNNNNQPALLYENMASEKTNRNYLIVKGHGKLSESFPKIQLRYDGVQQEIQISRVRGYLSSVENSAHFGLGIEKKVDIVSILWPSGMYEEKYDVAANQVIEFHEEDAKKRTVPKIQNKKYVKPLKSGNDMIAYKHKENNFNDFEKETLLPYKQSTLGPFMAKGDINGDGLEDVFIGGASGQSGELYIQTFKGYIKVETPAFESDSKSEDMEAVFVDVDNDNDLDLFVVSGGNEYIALSKYYADRLYINDGKGTFSKAKNQFEDLNFYSGKSVTTLDYDRDGDEDIVVGNRMIPGTYPLFHPSAIYENDDGYFKDVTVTIASELIDFGAVNKVISTDFNQDGWMDLMIVGEWTGIGLFKNDCGVLRSISTENGLNNERGWWFTIAETDINKDGLPDYIVGNVGLNSKYRTSFEKPLKIFAGDFDGNGTHDMMMSFQYNNNYVPLRGKECSTGQLPFIRDKFPTYVSFANATMEDVFGKQLGEFYENEVTEFKSIILKNKGNGTFDKIELPYQAQIFPVIACEFYDANGDGLEDAFIAGGIFDTEAETPRLDAGFGLLMISDGKSYQPLSMEKSGLYIPGNVKSIGITWHEGLNKTLLMVGRNNKPIQVLDVNYE